MKHSHYFKDVSKLKKIDVYRVLELFEVTDNAIGHVIKKLLCAGKRGAKDKQQDVKEAIDSLNRWLEMREEDAGDDDENAIASDEEGWFLASDYMAFMDDRVQYDIRFADGSIIFNQLGTDVRCYSGVKYIRPHRGFKP